MCVLISGVRLFSRRLLWRGRHTLKIIPNLIVIQLFPLFFKMTKPRAPKITRLLLKFAEQWPG